LLQVPQLRQHQRVQLSVTRGMNMTKVRKPADPVKRVMLKATPPMPGFKRVWTGTSYEYRPKTTAEVLRTMARSDH